MLSWYGITQLIGFYKPYNWVSKRGFLEYRDIHENDSFSGSATTSQSFPATASQQDIQSGVHFENLTTAEVGEKEEKESSSKAVGNTRRRAFTLASYKKDNNPMAVEHLAQALGLVRPSSSTEKTNLDRRFSAK